MPEERLKKKQRRSNGSIFEKKNTARKDFKLEEK